MMKRAAPKYIMLRYNIFPEESTSTELCGRILRWYMLRNTISMHSKRDAVGRMVGNILHRM